MNILKIIDKKSKSKELSNSEIFFVVTSMMKKEIQDYQMTSLLMAIKINGMNLKETLSLTDAIIKSGKAIDFGNTKKILVDKHSTGGVGDKVSLIILPILASLGFSIAKISGKGLGFTGGTIDKLNSIPGFNSNLPIKDFISNVKKVGIAILEQTSDLVPADKYIYSIRDITGSVDSLPLIASSIMSKKIVTGSQFILLDIKYGSGALMKKKSDAKKLANLMIKIGKNFSKKVIIEFSSMNEPLGRAIGNKNEIIESIDALKNNWATINLKTEIYNSVWKLLKVTNKVNVKPIPFKAIDNVIKNGKAYEMFNTWIKSQGGNLKKVESDTFWKPKFKYQIKAKKDGYLDFISTEEIGRSSNLLGAGRLNINDKLDYDAGIILNKLQKEKLRKSDVVMTLYSSNKISKESIKSAYNSFKIK